MIKALYDLGDTPDTSKFCVNIDVTLQDSFKHLDCMNNPQASSIILPDYQSQFGSLSFQSPWVIGGIILCCCILITMSGCAIFLMMNKGSTPKYRRRR